MDPADAAGGGEVRVPEAGVKPKLPKVPPGVLLALLLLFIPASRELGGKELAVGEARSCSSSSATLDMPPVVPAAAVAPKGLLPGKLLSAIPGWLECRCDSRNSARCEARRRWKKSAQACRMSLGWFLLISRSSARISFV